MKRIIFISRPEVRGNIQGYHHEPLWIRALATVIMLDYGSHRWLMIIISHHCDCGWKIKWLEKTPSESVMINIIWSVPWISESCFWNFELADTKCKMTDHLKVPLMTGANLYLLDKYCAFPILYLCQIYWVCASIWGVFAGVTSYLRNLNFKHEHQMSASCLETPVLIQIEIWDTV